MTTKRKPTKPAEIYALIDPRDGSIRYVGKANNSAQRLKSHMRDARRRRTPVYDWINMLSGLGMEPSFRVLEVADDWIEAERRHIAEGRQRGERLLNVADGGDQPYCPPEVAARNGFASVNYIKPNIRRMLAALGRSRCFIERTGDAERLRAYSDKIAHIKSRINEATKGGWLDELEARYAVYYEAIKNGYTGKVAAEKARQAFTLQG